jgi:hypothetical protein
MAGPPDYEDGLFELSICIAGNRTWLYRLPQSQKQFTYLSKGVLVFCMGKGNF